MIRLLESFETGGTTDEPLGDLDNNEYDQAQSFQLSQTLIVSRIDLYLKKVNTIASAITFRVETNAAGPKPSGTLVDANATASATPSNTSYDWVSFTLAAPITLTAATKYWIVCTVPNQTAQNRYDWLRNNSDGYASGGLSTSFNGGAFSNESASADVYFRVYGTGVKKLAGVANASIKKVSGVATASIKKVAGA